MTKRKILWIGGSSGLTRTFVNKYGRVEGLVLAGLESTSPCWWNGPWVSCDLVNQSSVAVMASSLSTFDTLILSVRAPLVLGHANRHNDLLMGLQALLEGATKLESIQHVLNISSVAAVNHLQEQLEIDEATPLPPIKTYTADYDVFKRKTEELVSHLCGTHNIVYTHLRISAIFSHDENCIQCGALQLQSRIGSYLLTRIDCNSSVNVAVAIQLWLEKTSRSDPVATAYYYTRPNGTPVPYGEHLVAYRKAYGIKWWAALWIPFWFVKALVALVHWLVHATCLRRVPVAVSVDYLLQVSAREHTFSNELFRRHFPRISSQEESILEAFVRRRQILSKPR